jgi:transcriptional regulator with XRE-family HTH domain
MSLAVDQLLSEARKRNALPPPPMRRYLRERAGLSQCDIAGVLNVTRPAVTRWESGTRAPRGELRLRYVELLERLAGEGL